MARITAKRYIAYSPPLFPAQVIAPTSANAWTLCGNNVKIRRSRWPKGRRIGLTASGQLPSVSVGALLRGTLPDLRRLRSGR
jgi:hypothetical protein